MQHWEACSYSLSSAVGNCAASSEWERGDCRGPFQSKPFFDSKGAYGAPGVGNVNTDCHGRTRASGFQLKGRRVTLDVSKRLCPLRGSGAQEKVTQRNRGRPGTGSLSQHAGWGFGHPALAECGSAHRKRVLEAHGSCGPLQPKPPSHSVISSSLLILKRCLKSYGAGLSSITFADSSWTATNLRPLQRKIPGLQLPACCYVSSFSPDATGSKEKTMEEGDASPDEHHSRRPRSEGYLPFLFLPQPQAFSTYPQQLPTQAALPPPTATAAGPKFLTPPETTQGSSITHRLSMLCEKQTETMHGKQTTGNTHLTQVERPRPITALWHYVRKAESNRKRDFTEGITTALAARLKERMKKKEKYLHNSWPRTFRPTTFTSPFQPLQPATPQHTAGQAPPPTAPHTAKPLARRPQKPIAKSESHGQNLSATGKRGRERCHTT